MFYDSKKNVDPFPKLHNDIKTKKDVLVKTQNKLK